MSFADEILRRIEDAWERFVASGIPGSAVTGQVPGAVLPPPAADADVPYAATDHTHPLTDLEQSSATVGQVPTWNGTIWAADDPAGGSIPLTTQGDLLTRDATTNVRLAVGGFGRFLRSDGTDPSWQLLTENDIPQLNLGTSSVFIGTLPTTSGGTGSTTPNGGFNNLSPTTTRGDLIVRGATVNQRLALGASGYLLSSDGTDVVWKQPAQGTRVYSNVALTLSNATLTALPFNAERFDDEGLHSTSSNTTRITFARAGRYLMGAHAWYATNGTGIRALFLRLNGSTRMGEWQLPASATAGPRMNVMTMYTVSAGDYLEAIGYQDSGGNLNIETFGNASAEMWVYGPL